MNVTPGDIINKNKEKIKRDRQHPQNATDLKGANNEMRENPP